MSYMGPPPVVATDTRPPSIYNMENAKAFLISGGTKLFLLGLFLLFVGILMIIFAVTTAINSNPKNVKIVFIITGIIIILLCFLLMWAAFAQWASSRGIFNPDKQTITVPWGTYFPPAGGPPPGAMLSAPAAAAPNTGWEATATKPVGESASLDVSYPTGQNVKANFGANPAASGIKGGGYYQPGYSTTYAYNPNTGGGQYVHPPQYQPTQTSTSYVYNPNTGGGDYVQVQSPQYYRAGGSATSAPTRVWPHSIGGARRMASK